MTYNGDVSEDIMTTFEISYEVFGSTCKYELVKDGKNVKVTNDNRKVNVTHTQFSGRSLMVFLKISPSHPFFIPFMQT